MGIDKLWSVALLGNADELRTLADLQIYSKGATGADQQPLAFELRRVGADAARELWGSWTGSPTRQRHAATSTSQPD
jgi:hypothetical protein